MEMVGRKFSNGSEYRYGFNGKEEDDEVSGDGNLYDYGFRIYNPRLGKFLSVDPDTKDYPWYTPYQFAGNMPIWAIDIDGLEEYIVIKKLNKDGSVKSVKILFTVNKSKPKEVIDLNFKLILGKNPDGSNILGEKLTTSKVVRIVENYDGKEEAPTYDEKLTNTELQIVKQHSKNEEPVDENMNRWNININNDLYESPIVRDVKKEHTDMIASNIFTKDFVKYDKLVPTGAGYGADFGKEENTWIKLQKSVLNSKVKQLMSMGISNVEAEITIRVNNKKAFLKDVGEALKKSGLKYKIVEDKKIKNDGTEWNSTISVKFTGIQKVN